MSGDPVDEYLAELRAGLRTTPARTAEILAEAEDHLRESAAVAKRGGHLSEAAAQRAAIEAFGPARRVTRAHRPSVWAFAAAACLRTLPLVAAFLLLSALAGALGLWREITMSGRSYGSQVITEHWDGDRRVTMFGDFGTPHLGQAVALFVGCVLAAVLLVAGFVIVRRRGDRSGHGLVWLPPGLVPLVATIPLIAFGMIEWQIPPGRVVGWLPNATGAYEIVLGSRFAAVLTGIGCALRAVAVMADGRVEAASGSPVRRVSASAYAIETAMKACQMLGGYLLLCALMATLGLNLSLGASVAWPVTTAIAGCVFAAVLLIAGFAAVRQRRRRSGLPPARLPRGLALLVSATLLLALAFAEYEFFAGDVMGRIHVSSGAADLILGSQWAAVLMGTCVALRSLASVVKWYLARGEAGGRQAAGDGGDLAPAG